MTKKVDILRDFYDRRHPGYSGKLAHWAFLRATYKGGREWFNSHIFKFFKEGAGEFSDRVDRAYRFNHTREVVDLVQKYLFKGQVSRRVDDAPDVVKAFWNNATLGNLNIDQLMRQGSTGNSIFGRVGIIVDNNMRQGAVTVAEVKKSRTRIYAYIIEAPDLLDYAYDEDGDGGLLWIKIAERTRDDADPINSSGDVVQRVRLWTRSEWVLYEETEIRTRGTSEVSVKVREIDRGDHKLGVVPCVIFDHTINSEPYEAAGLIDDIAYLDRAVANYLSNLDAIIQDQTFSQLAMPAQNLLPGQEASEALVEMGTKRVFIYDGGSGNGPEYLSPDPKQAGVILSVINKIINEIYHTIGLAGERTKEDNAVGIDNSSGVAKAYDFERVNSLLLSKAQSCEKAENALVELVCLWAGEKVPADKLVRYPESFDVMRLADELQVAEALAKVNAPIEVRRQQMTELVEKLFPRLKQELKAKILKDIETWMEGEDLALNPPTNFSGRRPAQPSRQGQVTKATA